MNPRGNHDRNATREPHRRGRPKCVHTRNARR
jgi:hypothetical protein